MPVGLWVTLLSNHEKLVCDFNFWMWLKGKSKSWLPMQATSILKEFSGLIMFSPLYSAESKEGENASPEKRVKVYGFLYCFSKDEKYAAPPLGSELSG